MKKFKCLYLNKNVGWVVFEKEFNNKQEARIEIENYINDVAWYGSYVKAYINNKLVIEKSIE